MHIPGHRHTHIFVFVCAHLGVAINSLHEVVYRQTKQQTRTK